MKQALKVAPDTVIQYWTTHKHAPQTAIFIHGFTGTHAGFQFLIPRLPALRCIVPDVPGFGESTIADDKWSVEKIAELLNEFTRQLQLDEPPVIIGHSMGGLVVAAMVAQAPELYDTQVVLLSPVPTAVRRADSRKIGEILGRAQYGFGSRVPRVGPKVVQSRRITRLVTNLLMTTPEPELRARIHQEHLDNLNYISSIAFYYTLHRDITSRGSIDYASVLATKDVLIVSGDKDTVTTLGEMQKLVDAINARFVIVPGVGHLTHYETPDQVALAVSEFLG